MPEPTTDDSFSYEGDIQPLNRKYFNIAGGISGPAAITFLKERQQKAEVEAAKTLELKAKGMQYETAKLALEENRRKSIAAQENMGALNQLQKTLDFGLTQVPEDKQANYFARASIQFANLIGTDTSAKSMFDNIQQSISKKDSDAEKLTNNIFSALDKVKFGKDYVGNTIDAFDSAGSAGAVQRAIKLGTPEEQQKAAEMTPAEQLEAALAIRARRDAAILQGTQKQQGPRSLFTSPTSP
jgi:hypothetical protein